MLRATVPDNVPIPKQQRERLHCMQSEFYTSACITAWAHSMLRGEQQHCTLEAVGPRRE